MGKTEFTQEEWDQFGIRDLGLDDFILSGEIYLKPASRIRKPTSMREQHPFPETIFLIDEAIKRLRDSEGDQVITLWRGLKNMSVSDGSTFLTVGGVEMAAMSCSRELRTALFYSHSPNSLIIKYVTSSFMERGADLAWISAFPGEKEVLYPPLTFLSPTGRTQKVGKTFTIVEVTPRL